MNGMKRMHPVSIAENISRSAWLMLLPLARGLIAARGGFLYWLKGAWFDLVILGAILGIAVLRWALSGYRLTREGIVLRKGFLLRREFSVSFRDLASISVKAPLRYRPFRAVRVTGDSDAGGSRRCDFSLTLSASAAEELRHAVGHGAGGGARRTFRARSRYVALLAFISSRSFAGVAFAFALFMQGGRIFGRTFGAEIIGQLTGIARHLAFGVPPAAVLLALIVAIGWIFSFGIHLSRNAKFTAVRQGDRLQIGSGLLTRYRRRIRASRVNQLELRQSLVTKRFGVASVFLHCAGYGKEKNELSVLFPAVGKRQKEELLDAVVPEWTFSPNEARPSAGALPRFLLPPLLLGILIGAPLFLVGQVLPFFSDLFRFLGVMFELPVLWWFAVRLAGFFHTGVGRNGESCTFRTLRGFSFRTTAVREEKIVSVALRQTPFQRYFGRCSIVVCVRAEGRIRHVIPSLPVGKVREMFGL